MYTLTVYQYSQPVAPFQLISFPPLPALSRECRRRWNKRPNSLVIPTLWAYIYSRKFLLHYIHYTLIRAYISMKMPLKSWNKSCGVVGLLTTTVLPDEVILGSAVYFDGLYRSLNMHMKSVRILLPTSLLSCKWDAKCCELSRCYALRLFGALRMHEVSTTTPTRCYGRANHVQIAVCFSHRIPP